MHVKPPRSYGFELLEGRVGDGLRWRGLKAARAVSRATELRFAESPRKLVNSVCYMNQSPTKSKIKYVGLNVRGDFFGLSELSG